MDLKAILKGFVPYFTGIGSRPMMDLAPLRATTPTTWKISLTITNQN
jgi:hypothetical protein